MLVLDKVCGGDYEPQLLYRRNRHTDISRNQQLIMKLEYQADAFIESMQSVDVERVRDNVAAFNKKSRPIKIILNS